MTSASIMAALSGQSGDPAEPDQSLQHMLKAIADERNRLTVRQDLSGLGLYTNSSILSQLLASFTSAELGFILTIKGENRPQLSAFVSADAPL